MRKFISFCCVVAFCASMPLCFTGCGGDSGEPVKTKEKAPDATPLNERIDDAEPAFE